MSDVTDRFMEKVTAPQPAEYVKIRAGFARGSYYISRVVAYWPGFKAWEVVVVGYGFTPHDQVMVEYAGLNSWVQLPPR